MSAPDSFDILTRLEDELISIRGLADALVLMATSESIGNGRAALGYLGSQLAEHHAAASEAFDEVFEAMKKPDDKGRAP